MAEMKRCTKCKKTQPMAMFSRNKRARDGLCCQCKSCSAAYRVAHRASAAAYGAQYYREHRDWFVEYHAEYHRRHKIEKARKDALRYREKKQAMKAQKAGYYATERGKAVQAAKYNRRRLALNGMRLTADIIQEVRNAAGGICCYCGEPFGDGHIDHVIPVSRGGTNARDNLVYCCATCNQSKSANTLEEWGHHDHPPSLKAAFVFGGCYATQNRDAVGVGAPWRC